MAVVEVELVFEHACGVRHGVAAVRGEVPFDGPAFGRQGEETLPNGGRTVFFAAQHTIHDVAIRRDGESADDRGQIEGVHAHGFAAVSVMGPQPVVQAAVRLWECGHARRIPYVIGEQEVGAGLGPFGEGRSDR